MGFGVAKLFVTPKYSAYSSLYVVSDKDDNIEFGDLQISNELTDDYMIMLRSKKFVTQASELMGKKYSYGFLLNTLHVSNPKNTRILKITVISPDEEFCAEFANALAKVAEEQIPIIMETPAPKIIETAEVDNVKVSPNVPKYVLVGLLLGIVASAMVVMIVYLINNNFKNEEDVMHVLGYDTLGVISEAEELDHKENKKNKVGKFIK